MNSHSIIQAKWHYIREWFHILRINVLSFIWTQTCKPIHAFILTLLIVNSHAIVSHAFLLWTAVLYMLKHISPKNDFIFYMLIFYLSFWTQLAIHAFILPLFLLWTVIILYTLKHITPENNFIFHVLISYDLSFELTFANLFMLSFYYRMLQI